MNNIKLDLLLLILLSLNIILFMITLDKCNGSCNTISATSGRICVPNKTKNINSNVFNLMTKTNESKKQ